MPDRAILAFAVLLGLAVLALPDVGEPAGDTTVVLLLAALPLTTIGASAGIDRDAIVRQAGCAALAAITIAQESAGEPEGRWIVIVRCLTPVLPVAEILRTEPYEAPRRVACTPSPFAGWCQNGARP